MADPFATAGELSQLIGLPEPADLARLQSLLSMASAEIRGYCRQTLSTVTDDVVTVYPRASSLLTLPERPVTAVSQVLVGGVATTSYYVVPRGIRSGTVASPGAAWLSGATVTYTHGYAESDPRYDELKTVCLKAAARAYAPTEVLGATVVDSAGYAPAVFLTLDEKEALRAFRRGPVR